MDSIANRIREGMEMRNLRQADIVEKTGINKGALSSYISGRYKPKQTNIYLIAKALDVNEAWLMGADVSPERTSNIDISVQPSANTQPLTAEPDNDNQQLTTRETELIDKYRNLDEYGKDVVETVASKEYDRCMADRENEIVLTPEQIRALPLQERLEAIKHDADFALVARRK